MQIMIDIPNKEVPNKQEIIDINIHFIAGEVCECTYPYIVLPKGHGRLIDCSQLHLALDSFIYGIDGIHKYIDDEQEIPTIIEAYKTKSEG